MSEYLTLENYLTDNEILKCFIPSLLVLFFVVLYELIEPKKRR